MALETYSWGDIKDSEELGPKGSRITMPSKQGLGIAGYFWPADNPKAVILLAHGHGSFAPYEFLQSQGNGKPKIYEGSWVQDWNKAGYSVCGIDMQSHGRSEGLHGLRWYFDSFDHLVDDLLQFRRVELPKQTGFQDLPVFICGISMGGCLAVVTLHKTWANGEFAGGILLAPMLSLERVAANPVNRILRPVSGILNHVAPTLMAVAVTHNTKFPDIQKEFDVDPYTSGGKNTRIRVACEYLKVTSWVMGELENMAFDFIVFHSDDDGMTDPDGSHALYKKSCAKTKTMTSVNSMWHYLTKEDGNRDVLRSAISWTDAKLG